MRIPAYAGTAFAHAVAVPVQNRHGYGLAAAILLHLDTDVSDTEWPDDRCP